MGQLNVTSVPWIETPEQRRKWDAAGIDGHPVYGRGGSLASLHANPAHSALRRVRLFDAAADDLSGVRSEWLYGPEWGLAYSAARESALYGAPTRGARRKGNPDPFRDGTHCRYCKRRLNVPDDPDSESCGDMDCTACIRRAEALMERMGIPVPEKRGVR